MDVWLKFNGVQMKWACGNVVFRRRLPSPCTLVVNVPDGMVVRQKYFIYLQGYLPGGVGTPITHQEGEANQTGSVKMTEISIFSDVITGSDIKRGFIEVSVPKEVFYQLPDQQDFYLALKVVPVEGGEPVRKPSEMITYRWVEDSPVVDTIFDSGLDDWIVHPDAIPENMTIETIDRWSFLRYVSKIAGKSEVCLLYKDVEVIEGGRYVWDSLLDSRDEQAWLGLMVQGISGAGVYAIGSSNRRWSWERFEFTATSRTIRLVVTVRNDTSTEVAERFDLASVAIYRPLESSGE